MTDQPAPEGAPQMNPEPAAAPPTAAYTPPPVAPPAMPQPAVNWAAAPAAAAPAAKGGRTPLAAVAGIVLLVLGILGGLLGLAIAVLGAAAVKSLDLSQYGDFGDINDPAGVIGGAVAFVGIIVLIYSLVYILGGVGVLRSRGWGRVIGIVVGILSGFVWLSGTMNSGRVEGAEAAGSGIFSLVLLIAHAYIVVTLIAFWRTKTAKA